jgi:acyl-CoA synthetase (AMP-forming)/AMP-acid ligase II
LKFRVGLGDHARVTSASALLVGDVLRRNARAQPDAPAASKGARVLTHRELDRSANRIAHALAGIGLAPGDRLVSWSESTLDVLRLFGGCSKAGVVFAPLNARFGADEAVEVVRMARPRALCADAERAEAAAEVAKRAGVPLLLRYEGGAAALPGESLAALEARASEAEPSVAGLTETDPHVIFFTSGSTGRSKGVVISHRVSFLRSFQGVFHDERECTVCMFPLFHMAGFSLALAAWQTGGELALAESAGAEDLLAVAERRRANRMYCIPAVFSRVLAADLSRYDLSSLRMVDTGTSATPPELIRALKERFPGTLTRIYYGSTEAGSAAVLADRDVLRKPGAVGRAAPGAELELTSAGEIRVRSPFLMDGYFDNPDATADSLREGWYHTGDLGVLDSEGYLSVAGRLRDIIRSGGESISPAEIEAALAGLAGAAELAVVGIPDPQWGEVVCAAVVLQPGASLDLAALQRHCGDRIARFKQPRRLAIVSEIPRTAATRQVQRPLLVERILAQG